MPTQPPVLVSVFYSNFSLSHQPDEFSVDPSFLWVDGNFALDLRPCAPSDYLPGIAAPTPGECGSIRLHLHLDGEEPDLQSGVYAVTFPLRVVPPISEGATNIFCGSFGDSEGGFKIPPGDYDVAAIFSHGVGTPKSEEASFRHFEVALHFLPRGTCALFGEHFDRSWDKDFAASSGEDVP